MRTTRFIAPALIAAATAALSLVTVSNANAILLLSSGVYVTGTGNGSGGANTSALGADTDSFGLNFNNTGVFRLADDFVVPVGQTWDLDTIDWFAYQTGSTTTSTFTSAFVTIFTGAPGGTVVAGDFTTNRLSSAVWTGVYRVTTTTLTNTQRPIMQLTLDASFVPNLAAGTYWVGVGALGSLASGPWTVQTTPTPGDANAQQFTGGAWTAADNNSVTAGVQATSLPFRLNGTIITAAVPEAGTGALLMTAAPVALGVVALRRRARRA